METMGSTASRAGLGSAHGGVEEGELGDPRLEEELADGPAAFGMRGVIRMK